MPPQCTLPFCSQQIRRLKGGAIHQPFCDANKYLPVNKWIEIEVVAQLGRSNLHNHPKKTFLSAIFIMGVRAERTMLLFLSLNGGKKNLFNKGILSKRFGKFLRHDLCAMTSQFSNLSHRIICFGTPDKLPSYPFQ